MLFFALPIFLSVSLPGEKECGGNFTDLSGSIISPNYPNFYPDALNCTYVIGKRGDYINLQFDELFSVEGHESCTFDYVEIFQGEVNESSSQGKYCGDTAPATRMLPGPVIVRFVSDSVYTAHGFKLHYDAMGCGAVYTDVSGVIGTPTAFGQYLNGMRYLLTICDWHIVAPENYVVQVRFTKFDLQRSRKCRRDYVALYDGNSTSSRLISKLCGRYLPTTIKSTGRELTIKFSSKFSRGFTAFYYVTFGEVQGCGGTLNSTNGVINFNEPVDPTITIHPEVIDCAWLILVNEPDQVVTITFDGFILSDPQNDSCIYNFLELREYSTSGPVLGTYCGNRLPDRLTTSATSIVVHLRSDKSYVTNGHISSFELRYAVTPSPCGPSTLVATQEPQTVTSPGYPNPYPVNIKCKWTLTVNYTFVQSNVYTRPIAISVTDINIPCGGDYLEIAPVKSLHILTMPPVRTCGDNPPQLVPTYNSVQVIFNSDQSDIGGKGFSLTYRTSSCNITYSGDNGVVGSQYYPSPRNTFPYCIFNITAPQGRTVALYFNQFELGSSIDNHCDRFMKIHDGPGTAWPEVGSYCGYYLPNPVFSTGRSLFVEVYAPTRNYLYLLSYTTTDKGRGCGGNFHSAEGAFTSPLYPMPYNVSGECVWHVSIPGYHAVRISFTSFALSNSTAAQCDANYLELYEGPAVQLNKRIARFCGTDVPGRHELLSNEATVRLVTDSSNDQPGFYARFRFTNRVPGNAPSKVSQNFNNQ